MDTLGQIIAIGGGGFGRNPKQNKIEKYILDQSGNRTPNIVFIPTASAEDKGYIVNFYSCFSKLQCKPSHINFFQRTPRLDSIVNKADIIYVGGGNTKSMLAVWREWKLDELLKKAYQNGKILCGVSAGAICWFDQGITASWASNLNTMDCLGFVEGMACGSAYIGLDDPMYKDIGLIPGKHYITYDGTLEDLKSKIAYY